ncbi:pyruvate:ferredoxin oxidoreductase [Paratrimastix pyriformis]|uniref:Pyruvate:ferredoxin oxidoreductase n=1 Tax=Paratrimastix pyriformis TaxID=342808 RepID=A0ABQ8U3Y7_9EUKA|nr:pyruvate:ferredoxin oxidoreductase [Paratrimastix pyriformis]
MYAMSLGTVYVASCCLGANMPQLLKALVEADRYPGTSLVICYCPCINHGLKQGQGHVAQEQKLAVQTGYWPLYRFNPLLKKEGKNPLALDSGAATVPLSELLKSEVRFASLIAAKPEVARVYHQLLQEDIDERFANLQRMAGVAPTPRPAAPATAAPATAAH